MPNVSWIMPQVDEVDSNRLMELMKYWLQHMKYGNGGQDHRSAVNLLHDTALSCYFKISIETVGL
jgi:hypothetical protein